MDKWKEDTQYSNSEIQTAKAVFNRTAGVAAALTVPCCPTRLRRAGFHFTSVVYRAPTNTKTTVTFRLFNPENFNETFATDVRAQVDRS